MMTPTQVIEDWVEAFNAADADRIAAFYNESATNHQVAEEEVIGREAIRNKFTDDFANAEMTCLIENIFEDGDWVILEWKDPLGLRGCGIFQVVDEEIIFQRGYWDKLSFLNQQQSLAVDTDKNDE